MRTRSLMSRTLLGFVWAIVLSSCAKDSCPLEDVLVSKNAPCKDGLCAPSPPEEGPGSIKEARYSVETVTIEESFLNSYRSFLYLPRVEAKTKIPVILFLHGYFDTAPDKYDSMLRYYASQGFAVIYPTYGNLIYATAWADNTLTAFDRALVYLKEKTKLEADQTKISFVGHSIGGILSFHLANRLGQSQDPKTPKLIVTTDAAGISTPAYSKISIDDLSHIRSNTKILMMIAEETYKARFDAKDSCESDGPDPDWACNGFAVNLRALKRTPQIPHEQKTALLILGEKRGKVEIRSDHNAAQGLCNSESTPINSLDTWGYWRNTTAALNAVLKDEGNFIDLKQRIGLPLGTWSDGKAARSAINVSDCFLSSQCPELK